MGNVGNVFIEGNRAGYRLTGTRFGALSLVGQVRSHQYIPEDSSLLERDKAVEMGVQLAKPINDTWTFQATALTDVSDTHKGQEFELGVYRRDFFGDLRVLSLLAVQQQTKKLTSYYASTDSYTANADTNFELELIGVYPVTEDIEAVMVYRHYLHGEEFKNSPITSGSETKKLSIGLGWRF
jgi:outer membrane scaffolding protein for murein synthesis (MipA/OmpV family)